MQRTLTSQGEHHYCPTHMLHSARETVPVVLLAQEILLVGTRKKTFLAVAPQLLNSLPLKTHLALPLCSFGRAVKKELVFWQAFS